MVLVEAESKDEDEEMTAKTANNLKDRVALLQRLRAEVPCAIGCCFVVSLSRTRLQVAQPDFEEHMAQKIPV